MTAMMGKEIRSYFTSPVGYVYIGIFYFFQGFYFFTASLLNNSTELGFVFQSMFPICLFAIPLLTMRLFSEERKNKTDQALLTAPISLLSLVMGKYLSALFLFAIGTLPMHGFGIIVDRLAEAEWAIIFGNYAGIFLLGAALIAIGCFLSSLTENTLIAAVCGIAAGMILMLLEGLAGILPDGFLRQLCIGFSFNGHYLKFTQGMLVFSDVIFFIGICAVFVCLSVWVIGGRRWPLSVGMLTAVVVMCYLCAEAGTDKFRLVFDLTPRKVFALSEESVAFIKTVDKPVEIAVMLDERTFENGGGYFSQAKRIIDQYAGYNGKIAVNYVDLVKNPTFASRYEDVKLNNYDIVISCQEKWYQTTITDLFDLQVDQRTGERYIASSKADQVITSAIMRVVSEESIKISLLTGHGETYSQGLKSLLENAGFEVSECDLVTQEPDKDASVVMLLGSTRDYTEQQLKQLEEYLYHDGKYGKNLIFAPAADGSVLPALWTFLSQRGIGITENVMVETDAKQIVNNQAYMCMVDDTEASDIEGSTAEARVLSPLGRELNKLFEERNGYVISTLLAYSDNACTMPYDADSGWRPSEQNMGSKPALLRSSYITYEGQQEKKSSVFVFAAANVFEESVLTSQSLGNAEYVLKLLNEVTDRKDTVYVEPKRLGGQELGISRYQALAIGAILTLVLPAGIMLTGMVVWVRRKNR